MCRHLHEKLACNAPMLLAVIATSKSKLYHTSTLGHGHPYIYYTYARNLRVMLTQNIIYLIPIIFVTIITDQIKAFGDKNVLATLNYENRIHT